MLLAACSQGAGEAPAKAHSIRSSGSAAGAAAFVRDCAIERSEVDGQAILVVRHPDGGFRRFEVTGDGTGVATADGAQAARIALREGGIEVVVGTDRYRFPATIAGDERR